MHRRRLAFTVNLILLVFIQSPSISQKALFTSGLASAALLISEPTPTPTAAATTQFVFEFSGTVTTADDTRERAVAFHSITFIDSIAQPISEIVFGTAEANALQGEGWFENEVSVDVGSFQWAGGATKQASMQLSIPQGTEGLLLKITSVKDSLWMDVKIHGELAATLRVDAYWHSGYVPIGEPAPEPTPTAEPEWIVGRYFPHFPPTDRVYAIRVRTTLDENYFPGSQQPEWRIQNSHNDMMALTLVGIQGIINRSGPKVYLDWNSGSNFWISLLEQHVEVVYLDLDGLSAVNFLMRRYADRFSGAVIYDPEVPETINLATMIAGLEDRIMLAPQQLGIPGIPNFTSIMDVRQLVLQFGWTATIESQTSIYQWVYDNLWPQLEHRIIGVISPGPPTSREIQPNFFWPLGMASRDYMVALRLPAIYLDPVDEPQASLLGQFLEDAPSPIPITGGFAGSEEGTTALASRYGDWEGAISWPGEILSVPGLTVFSGVRPDLLSYQPEIDDSRLLATIGDRPVATMFSSDGDAINYLLQRGYRNFFGWQDVQNQRFGWTINPTLAELAPIVWNYYVQSRSQVSLLTGLSGAGYMYPQLMNDTQIRAYLEYTSRYMDETGIRTVRVDSRMGPWTDQLASHYYDGLRNSGYLGAIVGYGGSQWGLGFDYAGVAAPAVLPAYTLNSSNGSQILEDLLARKADEVFVDVASNPFTHQGQLVGDADAFGGQAALIPREFINSPACCLAVSTTAMNLAGGDYTVKFRLKVPDNQAAGNVAQIYVGERFAFPDWNIIASQVIALTAFQQPGQYQDFALSFTLDRLTTDIEFRIDYLGGSTDLFVDYIHAMTDGNPGMPVFAAIFIGLIIDPSLFEGMSDAPGRFAADFESGGGIVLTPDEFLAALNPEFMIEFAAPILGFGHPAIVAATDQLSQGDHLGSLVTVRNALRPLPSVPALIWPPDDAIDISTNPTLTWNASTGATSYGLQVDDEMFFSPPLVADFSGLTTTSYEVSGLARSSTYYWRVNATNADGTSLWSSVWSFATSLIADFNGDSAVDVSDLVLFAAHFGLRSGDAGYDPIYDLTGDDTVDVSDLVIFASVFGTSGPLPPGFKWPINDD